MKKSENIVRNHPIICPHCGKDTGFTHEQFMFYVITHDIICPKCGKIVIAANKVEF
jgi:hypothetical protein